MRFSDKAAMPCPWRRTSGARKRSQDFASRARTIRRIRYADQRCRHLHLRQISRRHNRRSKRGSRGLQERVSSQVTSRNRVSTPRRHFIRLPPEHSPSAPPDDCRAQGTVMGAASRSDLATHIYNTDRTRGFNHAKTEDGHRCAGDARRDRFCCGGGVIIQPESGGARPASTDYDFAAGGANNG